MTFIQLINKLKNFWLEHKCIEILPYDVPLGAATYHPACFFQAVEKTSKNFMYVNPCRRLADGRNGESDQRLLKHHQFQVTLKISGEKVRKLYLESLKFLGIDNNIQFIDNNWQSDSIGAYGKGWEVWSNLTEITQFTFFQKIGHIEVPETTTELAYGVERLLTVINNKPINQCKWDDFSTYEDIRKQEEKYLCQLYTDFDNYSKADFLNQINLAKSLLEKNNCFAAYEVLLRSIYLFNCLEARKLIGQLEHAEYMTNTSAIAKSIVTQYMEQQNNIS